MLGPTKSVILPAVLSPGSDEFTLPVTKVAKQHRETDQAPTGVLSIRGLKSSIPGR